jgi:3-phenylpropionate/trans-cinnamate dioxygenase ferredoxin reductase subunit
VTFHLGASAKSIDASAVTTTAGESLAADLVVAGVGVRPELTLAESAGLTIDKGVVVDEHLRTSADGIWAIGDCARFPSARTVGLGTGEKIRVEHWVVAQRMGDVAARNVLGEDVRFDAVPFFWSAHYDVTIAYVGHASSFDEVAIDGDLAKRDAAIAYRRGGKTLAIATVNRDRTSLDAERAMEKGDEDALRRLVP